MSQVHEPWDSLWGLPSASKKEKKKKKKYRPLSPSYIEDPAIWQCIKPAMDSLAGGTAFYFDPRGDLTLKVGDSSEEKAMLFAGFAESRPKDNAPWTIEMPEDSVSPIFLVLSIVHGHFQHIPKSLQQDHLYQLLVVTEKYDMTQTLSPWASAWFRPYAATETSVTDGKEIVMWISWELGHEETFRTYAKDLLLKSRINDEGELLDSNNIALSTYMFLEPPGILETITLTRSTVIHEMTTVLHDAIQEALKSGKCLRPSNNGYYHSHHNYGLSSVHCNRLVLGTLIQQVHKIGLQEVALLQNATPKYLGSINDLLSAIQTLDFSVNESSHASCNPSARINDQVTSLVAKIESPVTDNHLEYLRAQAKKTGV
ncbi:nuclear pore protein-like protein [Colletotrichum kahawae]|uniref:Nuclear pore protein-like protein n=1 Tax=Colletotrichum kahawae TaxID=34407 RepID=A0AAD9YQP7_COLKA|nr:nuclear pore protein-like protein [Colletotrichum kahawae]